MIFFVIIGLIVLFYIIFGKNTTGIKASKRAQTFNPTIPSDYKKYVSSEVAGLYFRKTDARSFANSDNQSLAFEQDPNNPHDKNAIKIIGITPSSRYFIGYIPKDISKQIIETASLNNIRPQLTRIYQGDDDYIEIHFSIIGSKINKEIFDAFIVNKPADIKQKEFLKFFKIAVPKNLTNGQAAKTIKEHTKKLTKEDPDQLHEYQGYSYIFEQFDDTDFREGHEIKKTGKTIINTALTQLRQEGKTYDYLSNNPEEIIALILTAHPELMRVR